MDLGRFFGGPCIKLIYHVVVRQSSFFFFSFLRPRCIHIISFKKSCIKYRYFLWKDIRFDLDQHRGIWVPLLSYIFSFQSTLRRLYFKLYIVCIWNFPTEKYFMAKPDVKLYYNLQPYPSGFLRRRRYGRD